MPRAETPAAPVARVFALLVTTVRTSGIAGLGSEQLPSPPRDVLSRAYEGTEYSPYAGRGFPSRVYWGDTHVHTGLSADAGAFGNTLGLDEAYRFARGEQVTTATGLQARLSRPLDFLSHSGSHGRHGHVSGFGRR